jgi:hypothetical protein
LKLKEEIRLPLMVVSSIMNNGGYKALLNYLSMQCYKANVNDEYLNYEKFKDYSFFNEREWIKYMDKLCDINLATKNGSHYVTKTKYKQWRVFADKYAKRSLKFKGTMIYDMALLYKKRKTGSALKDLVYTDLRNSVIKNKSISRRWIHDLTGFDSKTQKRIEIDLGLIPQEHYLPVSSNEVKNNKVGKIPTFDGYLDHTTMSCFKTQNKSNKSNCRVIQLGNKLNTKCTFSYLHVDKNQYKKRTKGNLSTLNISPKLDEEVKDWYDYDILIDSSSSGVTKRGIISSGDKKYKSRQKLKSVGYDCVSVIDENGELKNIRNLLSK